MNKDLKELFDFVNGKIFPFTKGIWTHIGMDEGQTKLHNGLLELEKLGKVERSYEKKDFV